MTAPGRALASLTLAALFVALLSGCSAGLGEFCWTNDDCEAGLRCSASGTYVDGDRGVCTYPDGVPDATAPDQRLPDLTRSDTADLGPETSLDLGADSVADLRPDGPQPDGPLPDGPLPDGPLVDGPLPDAAAIDLAPSDTAADTSGN